MSRLVLRTFLKCRYITLNVSKFRYITIPNAPPKTSLMVGWAQKQRLHAQVERRNTNESKVIELMGKLKGQYQAVGYLNKENIQKVVNLLAEERELSNQAITADEGLFLMRACGMLLPALKAEDRWSLFEKVWKYLDQRELLSSQHIDMRLEVMKYNLIPIENVQSFLKTYDEYMTAKLYENLLELTCLNRNMPQTEEILLEIRGKNIQFNIHNYNALLRGYGEERVEKFGLSVMDENIDTCVSLILNKLDKSEYEDALRLLQEKSGVLTVKHLLQILRAVVSQRELNETFLKQILNEFPIEYLYQLELPVELRIICIELIYQG